MLDATPIGWLTWDLTVPTAGDVIAVIDISWLRERADVTIGDQCYAGVRESAILGTFSLTLDDRVLARARRESMPTRSFDVEIEGQLLQLRPASILSRRFGLF